MHSREDIRSELTRSVWIIRLFYLKAGELTGLGDDVFHLTYEELLDILAGIDNVSQFIPSRKEMYDKLKALPPYPNCISGRFDPIQWARRSELA